MIGVFFDHTHLLSTYFFHTHPYFFKILQKSEVGVIRGVGVIMHFLEHTSLNISHVEY